MTEFKNQTTDDYPTHSNIRDFMEEGLNISRANANLLTDLITQDLSPAENDNGEPCWDWEAIYRRTTFNQKISEFLANVHRYSEFPEEKVEPFCLFEEIADKLVEALNVSEDEAAIIAAFATATFLTAMEADENMDFHPQDDVGNPVPFWSRSEVDAFLNYVAKSRKAHGDLMISIGGE